MKIAFIRGRYLNNFELQSYYPLAKNQNFQITAFGSKKSIHKINLPVKKLFSPMDLPNFPRKLPILNRLYGDAMYSYGLEKSLQGYDIAHVRETYFHFSTQAIRAKLKGFIPKVLVTCSETITHNHETVWGRKKLKQNVIQNTDHFHCLTQKAKQTLITEGVNKNQITVIPYGIDLTKFRFLNLSPGKQRLTILFIGRLEEQKGIYELMAAWIKLKQDFENIELKIVGQGPLLSYIKRHGIEPIKIKYSQIPIVMNQADILVLPSKSTNYWEEYFGMVLLEAMACGLPIVTTNCGAIPEVVGQAALVVKNNNEKVLYQGLVDMIKNKNLRIKYQKLGLTRVKQNFDSIKQAKKLGLLYEKIINNK